MTCFIKTLLLLQTQDEPCKTLLKAHMTISLGISLFFEMHLNRSKFVFVS